MRASAGFGIACVGVFAQRPETKFFKLDFVIREVEGTKVLSSRAYDMTVSTDKEPGLPSSSIRAGSKVAVASGANQFNFVDLGVNIDCRAGSIAGSADDLSLFVTAEVSSIAHDPATPNQPIIRQNKWASNAVVPLRKPTVIFSSDDLSNKTQLQVQLTATPLR